MPLPAILLQAAAAALPSVVSKVGEIFDRVIPDKEKAEAAKREFTAAAQAQDFQLMLAQIMVNLQDAKSGRWWQAGWRPFFGWTCGAAFAYEFIVKQFLLFFVYLFGTMEQVKQMAMLPSLDLATLIPLALGLLGLAGYRTIERRAGAIS